MPRLRALALIVLAVAVAAGEATVAIRARSEVAAPRALLGDVADLSGDAAVVARLAAIPVAELPTLAPARIDADLVRALAARAAGGGLRIAGEGTVARAATAFTVDQLAAAAAATLPADAGWSLVRASGGLTVPAGDGLRLVAEALDPGAVGETAFRVRAVAGGGEAGRALVVLRVERHGDVVVATRPIARGSTIGPDALRVERRVITAELRPAVGLDPVACAGKVARRDIALGEALAPALLAVAPAVRSGSPVTAVWPGRGFAIEMAATALADAQAGERLSLRRIDDGAIIQGVAQADGTVLVQR